MTRPAPPYKLKRGGLTGLAAQVYIPQARGHRHFADTFSRALSLAKRVSRHGEQFAFDLAPLVAGLLPAGLDGLADGIDALATPPQTHSGQWYFCRCLAQGVATFAGLPLLRPLRWAMVGQESSKAIKHQGGKGRALGRQVECLDRLDGQRVAIIDDLFTTGITSQLTAEALEVVGAEVIGVYTLAMTERTEWRPDNERKLLELRRR